MREMNNHEQMVTWHSASGAGHDSHVAIEVESSAGSHLSRLMHFRQEFRIQREGKNSDQSKQVYAVRAVLFLRACSGVMFKTIAGYVQAA